MTHCGRGLAWIASCWRGAAERDSSVFSRGSLATQRHGAGPWRDGAITQRRQPWSSYACGSHASWRGGGGWVGRYAWASNCPDKRITALRASPEYSRSCANQATPSAGSQVAQPFTIGSFATLSLRAADAFQRSGAIGSPTSSPSSSIAVVRLPLGESSPSPSPLVRMHRVLSSTHHK
jgi:hypothetical protein